MTTKICDKCDLLMDITVNEVESTTWSCHSCAHVTALMYGIPTQLERALNFYKDGRTPTAQAYVDKCASILIAYKVVSPKRKIKMAVA